MQYRYAKQAIPHYKFVCYNLIIVHDIKSCTIKIKIASRIRSLRSLRAYRRIVSDKNFVVDYRDKEVCKTDGGIPKATLGRLPIYMKFLRTNCGGRENISATQIAKALGFGEVQVRKDLAAVSGQGKPKIGYEAETLIKQLEQCLGQNIKRQAVIVGAGKLGQALLDYEGFSEYGLEISAAFDISDTISVSETGKAIYPISELRDYCFRNDIRIGIITVPKSAAQEVCDLMVKSNISAIWSFASGELDVPPNVLLRQENLALSLAHLNQQITGQ